MRRDGAGRLEDPDSREENAELRRQKPREVVPWPPPVTALEVGRGDSVWRMVRRMVKGGGKRR